jgi:2-oxoglutarate dehydrogenase E1 component
LDAVETGVSVDSLRQFSQALLRTPAGFELNGKIDRMKSKRATAFDAPDRATIDWAMAEELAFASVLADGTSIRLTGEDVERGTFSQRHAVLYDARTGARHIPLQSVAASRGSFEIYNSPLSENATVGFEYGYCLEAPGHLVIWEAQYGDFINGAQTIIDEFVLSGQTKWGQKTALVLLLPHGSEGQGPDHASGRPERLLQLAADGNLRLANCTTAAQYFHLLRSQAARLLTDPTPLVVLTPKSLLRHPAVTSRPIDLAEGRWQPVLDDPERASAAKKVTRLVLCSGKFGIDLLTNQSRSSSPATAICRVEQLCPFPMAEIVETIQRYPGVKEVVWAQEEPENMGAWEFVRSHLQGLASGWRLLSLARPRSSSPAEGSASQHARAQARLIAQAFATEARTHAR